MESNEPIDEFSELLSKVWSKIKSFFPKKSHSDLKRTYGHECASVLLRDARHPDHFFVMTNGTILRNLCDLNSVLPEMGDTDFLRHVNAEKNDFAQWVGEIIGDTTLSNKLRLLDSRDDMSRAVNVRVNWLKSRIP